MKKILLVCVLLLSICLIQSCNIKERIDYANRPEVKVKNLIEDFLNNSYFSYYVFEVDSILIDTNDSVHAYFEGIRNICMSYHPELNSIITMRESLFTDNLDSLKRCRDSIEIAEYKNLIDKCNELQEKKDYRRIIKAHYHDNFNHKYTSCFVFNQEADKVIFIGDYDFNTECPNGIYSQNYYLRQAKDFFNKIKKPTILIENSEPSCLPTEKDIAEIKKNLPNEINDALEVFNVIYNNKVLTYEYRFLINLDNAYINQMKSDKSSVNNIKKNMVNSILNDEDMRLLKRRIMAGMKYSQIIYTKDMNKLYQIDISKTDLLNK